MSHPIEQSLKAVVIIMSVNRTESVSTTMFMKGIFGFFMVTAVLGLPGLMTGEAGSLYAATPRQSFIDEANRLEKMQDVNACVHYALALPMAEDEVIYTIKLAENTNPADSLLGRNYMIQWEVPVDQGTDTISGFTSYFSGHLYRFRDHKLQEYHHDWDAMPFNDATGGVHRNGQFVNLLPFSLASQLRDMASDSTYTLTVGRSVINTQKVDTYKGVRTINGIESQEIELSVDPSDGYPVRFSALYNPGMLGEQEVTATYSYSDSSTAQLPVSEQELRSMYPAVFDKYRTNSYSVESLRGIPLPTVALPTITHERYLHEKGTPFPSPMIVAFLDPEVSTTGSTVAMLRGVVDRLPRQTGLLLIFNSTDIDSVEELTGPAREDERILISATPFIRECGVSAYPTMLLCGSDGKVTEVLLGTSSTLADDLTGAAAIAK